MNGKTSKDTKLLEGATRPYPTLTQGADGEFKGEVPSGFKFEHLMGMKTHDGAQGVYHSSLMALGVSLDEYSSLMSAMFAEMEPRDGVEAMLIGQMTATHVAMTSMANKLSQQTSSQVQESCERSMTRLSRTFLSQTDALKKYRAKAQQTVRVERVNVESGGQAIVGDVMTGGKADVET